MHQVNGIMSQLLATPQAPPGEEVAAIGRKIFRWCLWDVIAKCHANRKCEKCILWENCRGRARDAGGFLRVADVLAMRKRVTQKMW
jgi:hypothetical protein